MRCGARRRPLRATTAAWRWLLVVALWLSGGCTRDVSPRTRAADRPAAAERPSAAAVAAPPTVGFRSPARLVEHFEKHGAEFGNIAMAEYLRRAQGLRDAPVGGEILEIVRGDGVISRFDRSSGAFLAFDADGTIRTFFRPNDGEAYFRRQARRRGNR